MNRPAADNAKNEIAFGIRGHLHHGPFPRRPVIQLIIIAHGRYALYDMLPLNESGPKAEGQSLLSVPSCGAAASIGLGPGCHYTVTYKPPSPARDTLGPLLLVPPTIPQHNRTPQRPATMAPSTTIPLELGRAPV